MMPNVMVAVTDTSSNPRPVHAVKNVMMVTMDMKNQINAENVTLNVLNVLVPLQANAEDVPNNMLCSKRNAFHNAQMVPIQI